MFIENREKPCVYNSWSTHCPILPKLQTAHLHVIHNAKHAKNSKLKARPDHRHASILSTSSPLSCLRHSSIFESCSLSTNITTVSVAAYASRIAQAMQVFPRSATTA